MPCRTALLLPCLLLVAACSSTWKEADATSDALPAAELARILEAKQVWKGVLPAPENEEDIVEGRWHLVTDRAFDAPTAAAVPTPAPSTAAAEAPAAPAPAPSPAPAVTPPPVIDPPALPRKERTLPVPKQRTAQRVTSPAASPEARARAHYLDNPTIVRADRITFYCPKAFLAEVRLKAEDVRETSATRRVGTGKAKLVCRNLTLLAERITLRVRESADAELQITARGDVDFICRLSKQAVHEEGLRSLILRGDKMTPLR